MPAEQPTSIRLAAALKKRLAAAAKAEHRKLSVQIVHILSQWADWFDQRSKK